MKKFLLIAMSVVTVALTVASCASSSSGKSEKKKQREYEVIAAVENRDYTVAINRAHPNSGSTLTSEYFIKIDDEKVEAYLPFIGQAYSITFEDKGIDFKTDMIDYAWAVTKNKSIFISFKARTGEEYYRFALEIFTNGTTYVTLTPLNKQAITYTGEIVAHT